MSTMEDMMKWILFAIAAACLNEWALIHYMASFFLVYNAWFGDSGGALNNIFNTALDYSGFNYPQDTNRIIIQHGINLGVAGLFANVAVFAMSQNWESMAFIAWVPFLVDVGYFIAIDLAHLGSWMAEL